MSRARGKSSSGKSAKISQKRDSLLSLGQALVEELDLQDSTDTLSRWMAHYVAELIKAADESAADEHAKRQEDCAKAILDLWSHRNVLPNGKRPFEDFEPTLTTLEALNPDRSGHFYYPGVSPTENEDRVDDEQQSRPWLRAAEGIDYSARILIEYCLNNAAALAANKTLPWVKRAYAAGKENSPDIRVVRRILIEGNHLERENEALIGAIENRLERLDAFLGIVEMVRDDLEEQLQALRQEQIAE